MDTCPVYNTSKTTQYCTLHKKPLNLYELLRLAVKDEDDEYIDYLVDKRSLYMQCTINKYTECYGIKFNVLFYYRDLPFGTIEKKEFAKKLRYYTNESLGYEAYSIDFEDLVKIISDYRDFNMLYNLYLYEMYEVVEFLEEIDNRYL